MESTITSQLATSSAEDITGYQFLGIDYWFGTPLESSLNHWPTLFLATVSTLILIGVLGLFAYKMLSAKLTPPQDKFLTRAVLCLSVFGPLGWVFVIARLLGVVFLSARFWWVIWLFGLVGMSYWLLREKGKVPAQMTQYQNDQLKKRYFPKKKKR